MPSDVLTFKFMAELCYLYTFIAVHGDILWIITAKLFVFVFRAWEALLGKKGIPWCGNRHMREQALRTGIEHHQFKLSLENKDSLSQ